MNTQLPLLTIWCNAALPAPAMELLRAGVVPHRLIQPAVVQTSNLVAGGADPLLAEADIALGQPDPQQVIDLARLRWIHLTSAGYTRYDTPAVRDAVRRRGAILSNSSSVYDEPCANHILAMMLAVARRLNDCAHDQATRGWDAAGHRIRSRQLLGQTALIYGYGAIARRLSELLAPFRMKLTGVRRSPRGDEPIPVVASGDSDRLLAGTDHVINILPAADGTSQFFGAARFAAMKPGAIFYNIGRGNTVDQSALVAALRSGRLAAAFLDVTDPEPPPPDHPLWTAPNCHLTPHTAGGSDREFLDLAEHFVANLKRFAAGETVLDRII